MTAGSSAAGAPSGVGTATHRSAQRRILLAGLGVLLAGGLLVLMVWLGHRVFTREPSRPDVPIPSVPVGPSAPGAPGSSATPGATPPPAPSASPATYHQGGPADQQTGIPDGGHPTQPTGIPVVFLSRPAAPAPGAQPC